MAKISSLGWIPKLFSAYVDARLAWEQAEAARKQSMAEPTPQPTPLPDPPTEPPMESNRPVQMASLSKQTKQKSARASKRGIPYGLRGNVSPSRPATQDVVLRELRETRRQLNRLAAHHEHLRRLHAQLDRQLLQIGKRVGNEKAAVETSPTDSTEGSTDDTT